MATSLAAIRRHRQARRVRVGINISRKINLGNYESAEVFASLSDIEANTTPADIEAALAAGALAYKALKASLTEKIKDLRNNGR